MKNLTIKRVYVESNGCAVLRHETERISKFFKMNGWLITSCEQQADIVVMTCCGVTHNEENEAISVIKRLDAARRKESLFIISGCLPAFAKERILEAVPQARLVTYQQLPQLDELISAAISIEQVYWNINATQLCNHNEDMHDDAQHTDEQLAVKLDMAYDSNAVKEQCEFCTLKRYIWQDADVFQIKVSYGCPGKCSYCATKLAIGDFKSVPKELVINQYRQGIKEGYKKFLLIGDEIGSYGTDFGENIIDLLNAFHEISKEATIAIRYIHPDIFVKYYEKFKPFFASGFVNYFCAAIQSASPVILQAMNRNPDIEPFVQCMEDMKKNGYKVNKHTQILVGFPGETGQDVLDTLYCLIRCDFDHININKYSPRRGTRSYLMSDDVPETEKVKRCSMFREWMMMQKKGKLYSAIKEMVLKKGDEKKGIH